MAPAMMAMLIAVAPNFQVNEPWQARCMIGAAMIPRGEVGLVFAELGRITEVFTNEIYAGIIIVVALTTLIPPFVMKWFYGRFGEAMPLGSQIQESKQRV